MEKQVSISDYGLIGNCRTAALISKEGSIDWCCFPRFDSPSFFGQLLSQGCAGHFKISPDENFTSEQEYLVDTNVLVTTFTTSNGIIRLIDFFPVDTEENKKGELWPCHEILRIVECLSGSARMKVDFNPAPGYGRDLFKLKAMGKMGLKLTLGNEIFYFQSSQILNTSHISQDGKSASVTLNCVSHNKLFFSLVYSSIAPAIMVSLGDCAERRLQRTIQYWQNWIAKCQYKGPYEKQIKRSALALKLLVYSPSGAVVAAPTTSLPEFPGGTRNWDYRYCWLRDASFTIRALIQLGFFDEAEAYMGWILHTTSLTRPKLNVVYDLYGKVRIPEKELSWMAGYLNSRPVRIGNAADLQFQLDVYGEVMNAIFIYAPYIEKFDSDLIHFLKDIADAVCQLWQIPDQGIWEIRSGPKQHTHSKAMAWIALDRLIRLTEKYQLKISLEKYRSIADQIREEIEKYGFNAKLDSYTSQINGKEVDASLLTMPIMDYDPFTASRLKSTVLAIKKSLSENSLVFRYKNYDDGIACKEGAFGACSFWMVEALTKIGLIQEAKKLMDELLLKANHLDLWPEELFPKGNIYLGNYPQAFTHLALIGAALALERKNL